MERDVPTLPADATIQALGQRLAQGDPVLGHRYAWPLVNQGGALTGLLTRKDLTRALQRDDAAELSAQAAGSSQLIVAYPDELLDETVARMARNGIGRLLVVDRSDPRRLLGYLGRTGIADAWRELVREEEVREAGWITSRIRLLRRNVGKVMRSGEAGNPGDGEAT